MKFIETIPEGGVSPRFYGVAWRSFIRPEIYCTPIPFNHIIRVSRQIWIRLKYPMYWLCANALLDQYHQAMTEVAHLRDANVRLNVEAARLEDKVYRRDRA
jgi:hypothetical protein